MLSLLVRHAAVQARDGRRRRDPNRLSAAPSGSELSYLVNVACSSNHRNSLKGFQKGENKSNQAVTVVSHSGAKCVFRNAGPV